MPLIYADTSVLVAYFHPRIKFSDAVDRAVRRAAPDFAYWNFLSLELRHNLRRLNTDDYGAAAWQALRAAEKTTTRLRWLSDLHAGRLIDAADELSAAERPDCGSADLIHLVAAKKTAALHGAQEFWTCVAAQAKAAKTSGLAVRWFKPE